MSLYRIISKTYDVTVLLKIYLVYLIRFHGTWTLALLHRYSTSPHAMKSHKVHLANFNYSHSKQSAWMVSNLSL